MHHCAGSFAIVAAPLMYFFLQESTRWLILNGHEQNAKEQLHKIASGNGRVLSHREIAEISGYICHK